MATPRPSDSRGSSWPSTSQRQTRFSSTKTVPLGSSQALPEPSRLNSSSNRRTLSLAAAGHDAIVAKAFAVRAVERRALHPRRGITDAAIGQRIDGSTAAGTADHIRWLRVVPIQAYFCVAGGVWVPPAQATRIPNCAVGVPVVAGVPVATSRPVTPGASRGAACWHTAASSGCSGVSNRLIHRRGTCEGQDDENQQGSCESQMGHAVLSFNSRATGRASRIAEIQTRNRRSHDMRVAVFRRFDPEIPPRDPIPRSHPAIPV
jgi:hypothetical protein